MYLYFANSKFVCYDDSMGYFNRDSNNRRGFSGGGGRDRGGRDDRPREMFKTVCSNCNKDCEVPFRPTTGKPVYCSDCFETMGGRESNDRRPERPERSRSDFSDRPQAPRADNSKQLEELNSKLDKIIELLTPKKEEIVVEEVKLPIVKKETKKVTKKVASVKKD